MATDPYTLERQRHAEAMTHANRGFDLRARGDDAGARDAFRAAFDIERPLAMSLLDEMELEPSRSIMFRSAASLALLCGEFEDARRLAHQGLAGSPSTGLRKELREVLDALPVPTTPQVEASPSIAAELRRVTTRAEPAPVDARWGKAA